MSWNAYEHLTQTHSSAVNLELTGSPPRARRRNGTRPPGVILESRKHSALTWSTGINTAWHRERKQVVEYSYVDIFLYYIICIKLLQDKRIKLSMRDTKRICDESYPKLILINTVRFVVGAYFSFNRVILFLSILGYVEKYSMTHERAETDLLIPPIEEHNC